MDNNNQVKSHGPESLPMEMNHKKTIIVNTEKNQYQHKVKDLQDDVETLASHLANMELKMNDLDIEKQKLEDEKDTLHLEVHTLKLGISTEQDENQMLRDKVKTLEDNVDMLLELDEKNIADVEDRQSALEGQVAQYELLQKKYAQLEQELRIMDQKVIHQGKVEMQLQQDLEEYEELLQQSEETYALDMKKYRDEIDNAQRVHRRDKSKLNTLRNEMQTMHTAYTTLLETTESKAKSTTRATNRKRVSLKSRKNVLENNFLNVMQPNVKVQPATTPEPRSSFLQQFLHRKKINTIVPELP